MHLTRINIAFIPNPDIAANAHAVSEALRPYGVQFTLSKEGPFPHITLYMTDVPDARVEHVIQTLETLEGLVQPTLIATGYRAKPDGYVDVQYRTSDSLLALQKNIAEALNPLREETKAFAEIFHLFSPEKQEYIRTYGYPDFAELYNPHLTFTRLEHALSEEEKNTLPAYDFSHSPEYLGVFRADENGACIELLGTISLSPQK